LQRNVAPSADTMVLLVTLPAHDSNASGTSLNFYGFDVCQEEDAFEDDCKLAAKPC
jgi:hypothetical protein